MQQMIFDGSWYGLLTAVFEVYEYRFSEVKITRTGQTASLFSAPHEVHTLAEKAKRVLKQMHSKIGKSHVQDLYKTFLTETDDSANLILHYIQYIVKTGGKAASDYSNNFVLEVQQTAKKVHREKHRMEAFIRFQCSSDGLYFAWIEPDFNVLPLIVSHFKNRYADQRWLIFDTKRKYGVHYDLREVQEVELNFDVSLNDSAALKNLYDEKEELYQVLWKQYFKSVNIKARKNTKLHIQHMPKRYWKYLIEKQE